VGKSRSLASTPISVALEGMGISIGRRLSGKPPGCWTEYDAVLNCCHLEYEENTHDDLRERYLFLDIPEGKKGEKHLGKGIPLALQFVWENNLLGKRILIHCSQGKLSMGEEVYTAPC
jgi:tRNA A64-2'-O-ribosylphosphate transferase